MTLNSPSLRQVKRSDDVQLNNGGTQHGDS